MSHRIATLYSSGKKSRSRSSSPSSDDGRRQQGFFVGGSEHSGNLVLGPNSSRNEDIISQAFNSAREHGAESLTPEENARLGTRDAVRFTSDANGYRLGNTAQPSELVESNSSLQKVTLVLWENGFTVDNGLLRSYNDISNHLFLQSVSEGRIPSEIMRQYPDKIIEIQMERRQQSYVVEPKPFTGQGQRLGEIVPAIAFERNLERRTNNGANQTNTEFVGFMHPEMHYKILLHECHSGLKITGFWRILDSECVKKAQEATKLVDGEPITHVQIRLPRGGRITGQFNHNHTVGDIRNFIVTAAPDYAFQPFNLMTTFPNKVIEQESISLKEAGLLNAVIVAKLV